MFHNMRQIFDFETVLCTKRNKRQEKAHKSDFPAVFSLWHSPSIRSDWDKEHTSVRRKQFKWFACRLKSASKKRTPRRHEKKRCLRREHHPYVCRLKMMSLLLRHHKRLGVALQLAHNRDCKDTFLFVAMQCNPKNPYRNIIIDKRNRNLRQ